MFAAVVLPEFPAMALLCAVPELRVRALAVVDGTAPQEFIISLNQAAKAAGLQHGMSKVQAEAVGAALFLKRQIAEERKAFFAAIKVAERFSPRVEALGSPENGYGGEQRPAATLLLDSRGMSRLFGNAEAYANELARELKLAGFVAQVATAPNAPAAQMLARHSRHVLCANKESVANKLASLPTHALACDGACDPKTLATFARWGILTLRDVAALPESALISRIGQAGRRLQQLARGEAEHLLVPEIEEFAPVETIALDTPLELLDSLLFVLSPMLGRLLSEAAERAYAIRSVELTLQLERGEPHTTTIRPALPTQNREVLLKLLHLQLQAQPPSAGIVAVKLSAVPAEPQRVQRGLFQSQFPDPDRLDLLIARLRSIAGPSHVGSPELLNHHADDAFYMAGFTPDAARVQETSASLRSRLVLRRFRPPQPLRMTLEGGRPARFWWQGKMLRVSFAAGPWHSSGSWWDPAIWETEQWDAVVNSPPLAICLQMDFRSKSWYVTGFYD